MKQRLQKRSPFLILTLLLSLLLAVPASANSAQTHWTGTTSTGAIITGEPCPIVVEKELLTFELAEFPRNHYQKVEDYLSYTGKVIAQYTFCNPSDYAVTATLVFPFGTLPDYGYLRDPETGDRLFAADTAKYDITVDGTPIEKTLRHTFTLLGGQFEPDQDLPRLHDGYMSHPFYSPEMPVTRYTYLPAGVDKETYRAASAAFLLSADPAETKVLMENQNGGRALKDAVQLQGWVDLDEPFVVNAIGEPLDKLPDWKFYENGACEKEISGTMTLINTETISLKEFLLAEYEEASGILESDWYNAMIQSFQYFEGNHGAIHSTEISFDISDQLMRWYEYELVLQPGQRVVNTVTAPIYPSINARYEPPVYDYTYLLSPAQNWKEFGALDIVIHTPHHLLESSVDDFSIAESGFTCQLAGLPEGELVFSLSSSPDPKLPARYNPVLNWLTPAGTFLLPIGAVLLVILLLRRKKHKRHI